MNEIKTTNTNTLEDCKELRQKYIERVDVLDKVKKLLMIPHLELMTMKQVAEYYEVNYDSIWKQYKRNCDEFESDGVKKYTFKEVNGLIWTKCPNLKTTNYRGGTEIKLDDNTKLVIPNVGIILFPKRAVLRMGMLLRDSKIAKEVRTQLLNITEKVIEENPGKAV